MVSIKIVSILYILRNDSKLKIAKYVRSFRKATLLLPSKFSMNRFRNIGVGRDFINSVVFNVSQQTKMD